MTDHRPQSFPARMRDLARRDPGAPALSVGSVTLSRADLDRRTDRLAAALAEEGLAAGDLLTIALPNGQAFMETAIACWKLGATPQPVSWRAPAAELAAIVALAGSPFVILQPEASAGDLPRRHVEDLLETVAAAAPLEDRTSACWKAPTSGGSTGRPKLILTTQPATYTPDFSALWRIAEDDVVLMPGPLYHNGPFSTAALALLRGAHLVIMGSFDPEAVLREVAARRATWLYLVPTMMNRIEQLPAAVHQAHDIASLRTVWHLAAPCPPWLKRAWIDRVGADVLMELYGATEGQAATVISGREWLAKPGSVGRPVVGEMKVVGPDGETLRAGEVGEIYLRPGEGAPPTYVYRGAQAETMRDGWETVGDIGCIDADGFVFLSDRKGDMILVGGANVYPAEVEAALDEHPGVRSSAVIGLPDDDLGNQIHAIIQADGDIDLDQLRAHLGERLVSYKRPRTFEIVEDPLRDDAGKIRRSQLRQDRLAVPA